MVGLGWRLALTVGVASLAGCFDAHVLGEGPGGRLDGDVRFDNGGPFPDNGTPDVGRPDGAITECDPVGAPVVAPIASLFIPLPPVDGVAQVGLGHNLDGMVGGCNVPDYANGVDNAFVDLAAALPALNPDQPIVLQDAINDSLACVLGSASCRPLDLGIRVESGSGCAVVSLLDGDGEVFENPGVGVLDANGNFRVVVPSFPLTFSYSTPNGPVEIPLRMRGVIITGRVVGQNVVDIIIGGSLQKGEFEATVRAILPLIQDDIVFEDVAGILANLYDMGANCTDLSIGLVANATNPP